VGWSMIFQGPGVKTVNHAVDSDCHDGCCARRNGSYDTVFFVVLSHYESSGVRYGERATRVLVN
jgi:hypothetical protein